MKKIKQPKIELKELKNFKTSSEAILKDFQQKKTISVIFVAFAEFIRIINPIAFIQKRIQFQIKKNILKNI